MTSSQADTSSSPRPGPVPLPAQLSIPTAEENVRELRIREPRQVIQLTSDHPTQLILQNFGLRKNDSEHAAQ